MKAETIRDNWIWVYNILGCSRICPLRRNAIWNRRLIRTRQATCTNMSLRTFCRAGSTLASHRRATNCTADQRTAQTLSSYARITGTLRWISLKWITHSHHRTCTFHWTCCIYCHWWCWTNSIPKKHYCFYIKCNTYMNLIS